MNNLAADLSQCVCEREIRQINVLIHCAGSKSARGRKEDTTITVACTTKVSLLRSSTNIAVLFIPYMWQRGRLTCRTRVLSCQGGLLSRMVFLFVGPLDDGASWAFGYLLLLTVIQHLPQSFTNLDETLTSTPIKNVQDVLSKLLQFLGLL